MVARCDDTGMPSHELAALTSPEVLDLAAATLLIPVGSLEQHGPHLPLDTDARIAVALAEGIAARRADTLVAPVVTYGSSGEHRAFAGTLSIGTETLRSVLIELGRSNAWFAHLAFVNGHGGNLDALTEATATLVGEGRSVVTLAASTPGGDAHAGRTETSLMLAIAPDLVRLERAEAGSVRPLDELLPTLRENGVGAVSPNGVLGDPAGASAAEGRTLLRAMIDAQLTRLDAALAR